MLENKFKTELIKEIKSLLPGSMVLHLDATEIQGIPDILVLFEDRWAALEVKKSNKATCRPNQKYYVDLMNKMSFSAFIFPENKEEVLDELQRSFIPKGNACLSKR